MSFVEAVKTCFQKYATFRGRAPRSEFWWFVLFHMLASGILSAIYAPLSGIFGLVIFLPYLAVTARRMHDIGRSGWWMLLPFGGGVVSVAVYYIGLGMIAPAVGLVATIWFIVWLCKKGTDGDNRFGPSPLLANGTAAQPA